jgi:hypothetical protein
MQTQTAAPARPKIKGNDDDDDGVVAKPIDRDDDNDDDCDEMIVVDLGIVDDIDDC